MTDAIVVDGLERAFDDVLAVRGVDLIVDEGEIYGFLGAITWSAIPALVGMLSVLAALSLRGMRRTSA